MSPFRWQPDQKLFAESLKRRSRLLREAAEHFPSPPVQGEPPPYTVMTNKALRDLLATYPDELPVRVPGNDRDGIGSLDDCPVESVKLITQKPCLHDTWDGPYLLLDEQS